MIPRLCARARARARVPAATPPPPPLSSLVPSRAYAQPTTTSVANVFNRRAKDLQRSRAARAHDGPIADYLRDEVATRLVSRLLDIRRPFPNVLDLGAGPQSVARALARPYPGGPDDVPEPLSSRIGRLTAADSNTDLLYRDFRDGALPLDSPLDLTVSPLEAPSAGAPEPETALPYPADSFDLVLSSLALHWINDLPGALAQANRVLVPDGAFVAAMLGGDTLFELRSALQLAETERAGGISPHVSPLADVRDVGGLLTRAGFKMLTVDVDDIIVGYPDVFALLRDLQAMGESSALLARQMGPLSRDVLLALDPIYRELHGDAEDGFQSIPATFRVIYMIGWKEGEGQAQPLPRGTAQVNLKDVLETK